MYRTIIIILLTAVMTSFATAAEQAKGYVFLDNNSDGKMNGGEIGIASVAVSNGRDVVTTDSHGFYELTVDDDDIIFMIKPSGYSIPVNSFNQPRTYYINKPKGSPAYRFPGVSPTGDLPVSIDFALLPSKESENFKMLVFGDTQVRDLTEIGYFERDIVSELANTKEYTFGVILGDNVFDNLSMFQPLNKVTAKIGIPWYHVIGNHDINYDAKEIKLSDETFEASYGPATYSFNYGKVHFIILDDILYPDPRDNNGYWAGFTEEQFTFLENDLKHVPKDFLIVLMMHIHFCPIGGENPDFRMADRQKLFNLLEDFPNTLSMSAHTHTQNQYFFTKLEGWHQEEPHHHYNVGTTCGDWWAGALNEDNIPDAMMIDGTPNGYAILTFTGNQYIIDYKVARAPAEKVMNIYAPKAVRNDNSFPIPFFVNFFLGNEKCKLEYRIDNSGWRPLRVTVNNDPARLAVRYLWDSTEELPKGMRPANPANCYHLWSGQVQKRLDLGPHTIEVRVTDMFGRVFTDKAAYKVIK